jgi:hypothetical protein
MPFTRYLGHISSENDPHHVAGKISMLRQFFVPKLLPYKMAPQGKNDAVEIFKGEFVDELSTEIVLKFYSSTGKSSHSAFTLRIRWQVCPRI